MSPGGGWLVCERTADPAELHLPWPSPEQHHLRILCRCHVVGTGALVLGSAQPEAAVDLDALDGGGVGLVRRRSGGGAVLLAPGAQLWLEAWIPRHDPLWEDDVVRGAEWLGDTWAAALTQLGAEDLTVHRGRARNTHWSARVCFAGLGPGELTWRGRKVVGLSQRRSAPGARLQSMAMVRWDPAALLSLLALSTDDRAAAEAELSATAAGLAELFPGHQVHQALLDRVSRAVEDNLPG